MRPPLALLAVLAACGKPSGDPVDPRTEPLFTTGTDAEIDALVQAALGWLEGHVDPAAFGDVRAYEVRRAFVDDLALGHVHLQQTVGGVPVFGGQAIVHLHDDGTVRALTDTLVHVGEIDTTPLYTADEAIELAGPVDAPAPDDAADALLDTTPRTGLWVLKQGEAEPHLVWSVQLWDLGEAPSMPRVFVDAHTGQEVWRYDNMQRLEIQQPTLYDGTQPIEVAEYPPYLVLEDPLRTFVTFDFANTTTNLYAVGTTAATFGDTTLAQLHFGTQSVEDYYWAMHGRDGIDGLGGPGSYGMYTTGQPAITGAGHYASGFSADNAYWDTINEIFISGDGYIYFDPLVSLDVVAHEFTHGVTDYTSDLIYANESGALNESVSDVFGAAVEAFVDGSVSADTWDIGEDCYSPGVGGDALRYMDDPTLDGDSRDHYDDRYVGFADNGGVHWNSGIGNLAFYLVSEGGNHPTYGGTAISGVGIDAAAAIWYRANTVYATSSTDFQDFRQATLLAAVDLFGVNSAEEQVVDEAWRLVGVTPWVLLPSGYAANGVGSPSVVYRKPTGEMVMAFETMTAPPSADCPNGEWSIGLATSNSGRSFSFVQNRAVLEPQAGTYRSCVVAHPTLMLDDTGDGLHLWFKAETDLTTCGGDPACLYSGVGYAHIASNLRSVDTISSSPVVTTSQVMGYPSVTRLNGTYVMGLQSFPDVFVATASAPDGPWTLSPSPALSPGILPFAQDEVYNPALTCDDTELRSFFGGRNLDPVSSDVADGGIGDATSADGTSWSLAQPQDTLFAFTGNERWRHWSALRHGNGQLFYFDETVNGANRIGLRTRLTDWTLAGLSSRTCPQPAWW